MYPWGRFEVPITLRGTGVNFLPQTNQVVFLPAAQEANKNLCEEVKPRLLEGLTTMDAVHNICAIHVVLPRMIMTLKANPSVELSKLFATKKNIATPVVRPPLPAVHTCRD